MEEIWRIIDGYDGIYSVSNLGNVKNNNRDKLLKCPICSQGYKVAGLTKNKKRKTFKVHRLVAESFITKVKGKYIVNHIDGIKTNNNVENLEWCTNRENIMHAIDLGLIEITDKTRRKMSLSHSGEKNFNFGKKMSEETKQKLRETRKKQRPTNPKKVICINTLEVFDTIKEAGIFYNIKSHNHIVSCCKNRRNYCGLHPITKDKLQWMYYEEYIKSK